MDEISSTLVSHHCNAAAQLHYVSAVMISSTLVSHHCNAAAQLHYVSAVMISSKLVVQGVP